jgi:hypothetical protein
MANTFLKSVVKEIKEFANPRVMYRVTHPLDDQRVYNCFTLSDVFHFFVPFTKTRLFHALVEKHLKDQTRLPSDWDLNIVAFEANSQQCSRGVYINFSLEKNELLCYLETFDVEYHSTRQSDIEFLKYIKSNCSDFMKTGCFKQFSETFSIGMLYRQGEDLISPMRPHMYTEDLGFYLTCKESLIDICIRLHDVHDL